jgi:hypothetical protein
MSEIEVLAGFASDVPTASQFSFSFSIGDPPVRVSMGAFGSPPFNSNEYIAVAAKRSSFAMSPYIALAYRRVGLRAAAQMVNLTVPIALLAVGVMGCGTWALAPTQPKSIGFAALGLVAVLVGASQLRGVARAKRLLDGWEGSPKDLQTKSISQ